jgi:hypothetical protein
VAISESRGQGALDVRRHGCRNIAWIGYCCQSRWLETRVAVAWRTAGVLAGYCSSTNGCSPMKLLNQRLLAHEDRTNLATSNGPHVGAVDAPRFALPSTFLSKGPSAS